MWAVYWLRSGQEVDRPARPKDEEDSKRLCATMLGNPDCSLTCALQALHACRQIYHNRSLEPLRYWNSNCGCSMQSVARIRLSMTNAVEFLMVITGASMLCWLRQVTYYYARLNFGSFERCIYLHHSSFVVYTAGGPWARNGILGSPNEPLGASTSCEMIS